MIMLGAAVGALLLCMRVEPAAAAGVGLVIAFPIAGIVGLAGLLVRAAVRRLGASRAKTGSEAQVLTSLATSVGSGATVRQALLDTASSRVSAEVRRRCLAGRPMAEIVGGVASGFPDTARELAVVLDQSERVGSRAAGALHELARSAGDAEQRARDLRVAVAQSRFSAMVIGVVPLIVGGLLVAIRGVPDPGGPIIMVPMAVGGAMMILGSAVVFALSRRVPA